METDPADTGELIRNAWRLHRFRAEFEKELGRAPVRAWVADLDAVLDETLRFAASRRAAETKGRRTSASHAGYVLVTAAGQDVFVPFHAIPGSPGVRLFAEALTLARKLGVGGGQRRICLSGSALFLRDLDHVGDLDFCEYVARPKNLGEARELAAGLPPGDPEACCLLAAHGRPAAAERVASVRFQLADAAPRTADAELIAARWSGAVNGKLDFLVATELAGVAEATNWLVFHTGRIETDAAAQLSHPFQEAALGVPTGRSLTTGEGVARYLDFLHGEIEHYAKANPVKAIKRAVPLLRLLGRTNLLDELLERARKARVLAAAAALARGELAERLRRDVSGAPPALLVGLERDASRLASLALDRAAEFPGAKDALEKRLAGFARALRNGRARSIWRRILAVAPTA